MVFTALQLQIIDITIIIFIYYNRYLRPGLDIKKSLQWDHFQSLDEISEDNYD